MGATNPPTVVKAKIASTEPRSNAIWSTRRNLDGCFVRCAANDLIEIVTPAESDGRALAVWMTRPEARLLAKRLNECLDATVKS